MKKTAKVWSGSLEGETITCEIVGELVSGRKVWAHTIECGHHEELFTLHNDYGWNFMEINPGPYDWKYYENYNPCDCIGFIEELNSWK